MSDLTAILDELTERDPIPGAGVGLLLDGQLHTAFTGVTSLENPLALDESTLFQVGSISKTYTVTAVLALVTEGRLALEHPVREYLPGLRLADDEVAASVTVGHLLNHTAGWDGTMTSGQDDPHADLEWFVGTTLPTLEQVGPLGRRAEYNNAALALAGHVVERITGTSFEKAVRTLLLHPLGLHDTHFVTDDLMVQRFSVGHVAGDDGVLHVARPWTRPLAANPEGGIVSTLEDQLRWARFHLGDGTAVDGSPVLDPALLAAMRTPTAELLGNPMGEAIGLGWFLGDLGGERVVMHAGSTNGQFSELRLVPARGCAVIACANADPQGPALVRDLAEAVLAEYLDIRAVEPDARSYDPHQDGDVSGTYANNLATLEVEVAGDGTVRLTFAVSADYAATLETPPTFSASELQFVATGPGEFSVRAGSFQGTAGAFVRDAVGSVEEVAFGGRWYQRRHF